jgi:nicotinic acid mononucleotide adenylyltransferase
MMKFVGSLFGSTSEANADAKKLEAQRYYESRLKISHIGPISTSAKKVEAPIFHESANNVRVIGVAGCTRSGKSTLSQYLQTFLQESGYLVEQVALDDFFGAMPFATVKLSSGMTFPDLESPLALRWTDFASRVDECVRSLKGDRLSFIIVEGFLLYHFESVRKHCDVALYIDLDRDTCRLRRMRTKAVPDEYFDELLWPHFQRYGCAPRGAVLLDGSQPREALQTVAIAAVRQAFREDGITTPSTIENMPKLSIDISTAAPGNQVPISLQHLWKNTSDSMAVALILSGAFNPPHKMHIECLSLARRHLENSGIEVIAGFMAPSSDGYIRSKVEAAGESAEMALPLAERSKLCQLAIDASPATSWLRVLPWGIMSGSSIKRSVERSLSSCGCPVHCLTLYGADFFTKMGDVLPDSVCVPREGCTEALQQLMNKLQADGQIPEHFYCTPVGLQAMSSSEVRSLWKSSDWCALQQADLLHPAVLEELQTFSSAQQQALP